MRVHPTALIASGAELGVEVSVGPFSVIGDEVVIGDRCVIHGHVVIDGRTELGERVEVYPQAVLGTRPQDLRFDGDAGWLRVGPRTVIREAATLNPGSRGEGRMTVVGADTLIMAYCHVAHDCRIGDRVVMANATQVAGHCEIEDAAVLGGATTVHQHCRIGTLAMTGASARIQLDVPPYCIADGNPAALRGLNRIGLRRDGWTDDAATAVKRAYRALFREGRYADALAELTETTDRPEVARLCAFLRGSERGVTRARRRRRR